MQHEVKHAVVCAAMALFCAGATAQVETFESVGFQFLDNPMPSGFQFGTLGFSDWFAASETDVGASRFAASSGTKLAFAVAATQTFTLAFSEPIRMANGAPFFFNGANFSGAPFTGDPLNPVPVQVSYRLFDNNNVQLAQTTLTNLPVTDNFLFVPSGFSGLVHQVVVYGHSGFYGMDDFNATPVPEPGSYLLMLAGLALVGTVARSRNSQPA